MKYFSRNLKLLRQQRKLSQTDLATAIGAKANTISNYENGISEPGIDIIAILVKLLDITADQLLFIDLSNETINHSKKGNKNVTPFVTPFVTPLENGETTHMVQESSEPYISGKSLHQLPIVTVASNESTGAKCLIIDAKAAAGWPLQVDATTYYQELPQFTLPILHTGDHVFIQVIGDSMEPTLSDSDWVLAKRIYEIDQIREGYVHLILLEDGPVVKRAYARTKKGFLSLVSDNPAYNTRIIPIESILHIYKVEMFMSNALGPPENNLVAQIARINNEITAMKAQIKRLNGV